MSDQERLKKNAIQALKEMGEQAAFRPEKEKVDACVKPFSFMVKSVFERLEELEVERDKAQNIASDLHSKLTRLQLEAKPAFESYEFMCSALEVLSSIWFYGDWKYESPNERKLEEYMVELGLWPTTEDKIIERTQAREERERGEETLCKCIECGVTTKQMMIGNSWTCPHCDHAYSLHQVKVPEVGRCHHGHETLRSMWDCPVCVELIREELEDFKTAAEFLWSLLDNIDTLDDACRENDLSFRDQTRKQQRRRFDISSSDGYDIEWLRDKIRELPKQRTCQWVFHHKAQSTCAVTWDLGCSPEGQTRCFTKTPEMEMPKYCSDCGGLIEIKEE